MKGILNYFAKNWANFRGRSSRKEYWLFYLFILFWLFASVLFGKIVSEVLGGVFIILFFILFFVPQLGVTIRRLHDTGKSGWTILISIIPIIGGILMLVFMCQKGKLEENRYGPNPLLK